MLMCGFCDFFTLANLKDTAFVAGAATAIYVSLAGLSAWKTQLIGTDIIKTIRSSKLKLLEYRECIKRVRDLEPTMGELSKPTDETDRPDPTGVEAYIIALKTSYDESFKELANARAGLEASFLEVEVVASPVLQTTKDSLFNLENELKRAVRAYIAWQDPKSPQMMITAAWKNLEPRFEIVVTKDLHSDDFANSLDDAIRNINSELDYRR